MGAIGSSDDDYYTSFLLMKHSQILENNHTLLSDDDTYAQELHLQETLLSSFTASKKFHEIPVETGESSSLRKHRHSMEVGESSSSSFKRRKRSSKEIGESSASSSSSRFMCEICVERKKNSKMFPFFHHNCSHKFCVACISKYVNMKLKRGKSPSITRPGPDCDGILGIDECIGGVLPDEIVTLWNEVICESVIIPSSQRFYCPYKNCSALLMNDSNMKNMREAECPSCNRLFCVKCKVRWHSKFDCQEFSRMKKSESRRDDLMVHDLAKKKKWRRCRRCKFFVERNTGCSHMTCRCGFQFCYRCGAAWSLIHCCE